jgi:hypothetical protein
VSCLCSTLHFYNLKAGLTNPQMMVVAELEEPFLPLPDDLLVNANESRCVWGSGVCRNEFMCTHMYVGCVEGWW